MSRKLMLLTALIIVLAGTLGLTFKVQRVEAGGTIYIRADGSIDGPANITTVDYVTYYFNESNYDEIVIQRENITLDGAGYTLQGAGSGTGILVYSIGNVTIENMNIKEFNYGIHLQESSNNSIAGNNMPDNLAGIWLNYSSFNSISGNNMTANSGYGIVAHFSIHNSIFGNNITDNYGDGINLSYSCDHNSIYGNNIKGHYDDGIELYWNGTYNNISGNNIEANTNTGIHLHWYFHNSNITGNNVTNNKWGIYLDGSSNNTIAENHIEANKYPGITLWESLNNTLSKNNIIAEREGSEDRGIMFFLSKNNTISGNYITNGTHGIWLDSSSNNNTIFGNTVIRNENGIRFDFSSGNLIYHNNFIDNTRQAYRFWNVSMNIWDDGYPSGGNYWSDYNGTDAYYGENATGLPPDGIGDTSYTIDANNTDRYPLMGMFSDFNATSEYHVQTICNSSISDFQFNGTAISFNVTGETDTTGFCRICIPTALMNETFRVFVNGTEILPSPEPLPCSNSTHNYLYFTYQHSEHEVIIVPEFPSFIILPLFMITTLLAVMVYRRKHSM